MYERKICLERLDRDAMLGKGDDRETILDVENIIFGPFAAFSWRLMTSRISLGIYEMVLTSIADLTIQYRLDRLSDHGRRCLY
jgi:hypothetical protein